MFDACSETDSIDSTNNFGLSNCAAGGRGCSLSKSSSTLICNPRHSFDRASDRSAGHPLLYLHRVRAECGEIGSGGAASRSLIPGGDVLQETDTDDSHAPCKVLSPGLHNRRHSDGGEADDGLCLEEAEEGDSVGCHVGGRVGVTEARGYARRNQAQTSNDCGCPSDSGLVDSLGVGKISFHAGDGLACIPSVHINSDDTIKIRHCIGDARNSLGDAVWDNDVGLNGQLVARLHGAESREVQRTRIQGLIQNVEAIRDDLQLGSDIAADRGDTIDIDPDTVVARCKGDVEESRSEPCSLAARIERVGFDDPYSVREW